jgi:hypothetical protein
LADYLKFIKFFSSETNNQSPGLISNTETLDLEERALNFLHKMDYSVTKAKFYLIFPLFLSFNKYRPHHKIELTEEEMNEKIEQYLNKIKESKVNLFYLLYIANIHQR